MQGTLGAFDAGQETAAQKVLAARTVQQAGGQDDGVGANQLLQRPLVHVAALILAQKMQRRDFVQLFLCHAVANVLFFFLQGVTLLQEQPVLLGKGLVLGQQFLPLPLFPGALLLLADFLRKITQDVVQFGAHKAVGHGKTALGQLFLDLFGGDHALHFPGNLGNGMKGNVCRAVVGFPDAVVLRPGGVAEQQFHHLHPGGVGILPALHRGGRGHGGGNVGKFVAQVDGGTAGITPLTFIHFGHGGAL